MNDIVWLTMRRMRTPLIISILVYNLSVFGMVMIPGRDELGNAIQVGYLDAAYFVAYMATTIGFGEIPAPFTGAQRLYVLIIMLPNVVAWIYSAGTIIGMFLDPQFQAVLARSRFTQRVANLHHGFFIVCGFGNTGQMIVRALLRRGYGAVVLEEQQKIIQAMALSDDTSHVPALAGDVTDRQLLDRAGLRSRHCLGVMAITNDDHANLTIAITCKLLRPQLLALARSETPRVTANMASFGTDHIVEPYGIFAERLYLAFESPDKYLVQDWLISVPGSELRGPLDPPTGRWLLCGLGRFGSRIAERLDEAAMPYTVIDVHPERVARYPGAILGRGTERQILLDAKVEDAVGIIAGTGDDVDNLSIVMTARHLNPRLFVVARQESQENDELFDASGADLVARRSVIVARRMLMVATTPLLPIFLEHLLVQDDRFAQRVAARLEATLKGKAQAVWMATLSDELATGLDMAKREGVRIQLAHILRHSRSADREPLPCLCLLLERGAARTYLPDATHDLHVGDRLLFAGRESAKREIAWSLREPHMLIANATGRILPRSALGRWLARTRQTG
jgi:Trk K+ transport system NAD-binding subunit